MRVEPVTGLVQRRPDRLEVVLAVPRREPHVAVRERRAERVRGRVETPGAAFEAERRHHALGKAPLRIRVELALQEARVDRGRAGDEVAERRRQHREHLRHLTGGHLRLVVVEQGRVRVAVRRLEALGVAAAKLDVLAQVGQKAGEIRARAGVDPGMVPACARPGHLLAQRGRDPPRLLPVAARDADEAGVVGVVLERFLQRREAVEQAADLVVREALVCQARQRRELVRPRLGAERRHRHALVPAEHPRRAPQVGDLGEPLLQVAQRRIHFDVTLAGAATVLRCAGRPDHRRHRAHARAAPRDPDRDR